jgi:hypothetical protein
MTNWKINHCKLSITATANRRKSSIQARGKVTWRLLCAENEARKNWQRSTYPISSRLNALLHTTLTSSTRRYFTIFHKDIDGYIALTRAIQMKTPPEGGV